MTNSMVADPPHSNASDTSWWPKPSTWKHSGADYGFWTSKNEAWFRGRLAKIRSGEAQPHNAKLWRQYLKYSKLDKEKVLGRLEQLSSSSL